MFEILLLGLAVIVVYAISHYTVMWLETLLGKAMGGWRTPVFFCVFLVLFLVFRALIFLLVGTPDGGTP